MSLAQLGKKRSKESRERYRLSKLGKNNPMWKDDNIKSMTALHAWVRSRLQEPSLCDMCHNIPPYDLANTTGKYTRDLSNWAYYCRKCHMISDGRLGFMYGKKHTEQTKKKIRDSSLYIIHHSMSEETKMKIALSKIGKPRPDYVREKMAPTQFKKGNIPWNTSKSSPEFALKGERNPMYGKKHSDETRRKMSESHKNRHSRTKRL